MADEICTSVHFTDGTSWETCWEDSTPYAGWTTEDVTTGLRLGTKSARGWRTCQYYLKGMSSVCKWWKEGTPGDEGSGEETTGVFYCSFIQQNTSDDPLDPKSEIPTGFNNTKCDFLGRRSWCSAYEPSKPQDTEEWTCVAPDPYLTGVGKKRYEGAAAVFTPIPRSGIFGFNDADNGQGVGLCDCHGMGRGVAGCPFGEFGDNAETNSSIEEQLSELPIICNFYRPFQMGFGLQDPSKKTDGDVAADGVTVTSQGWEAAKEWEDTKPVRLPLNYEMFNNMAQFQKCMWWRSDFGTKYVIDDVGFIYLGSEVLGNESGALFDSTGRVVTCKCTSIAAAGFNTRSFETWTEGTGDPPDGIQALWYVWANKGGAVCNGARADCPCYTGKWKHLMGSKMLPGMAVTANQILELRFWSQEWETQKAYDDFYYHKPNFDDPRTSSIYTFTKWFRSDDISTSKMKGLRLSLCQPAPLNAREFSSEYIESEEIEYYYPQIGTSSSSQIHYPSLIRQPFFPELKPLTVTYPYYNDNVFDEVAPCTVRTGQPAYHIKRHNDIYGDSIRAIGQTIPNKRVYVINTEEIAIPMFVQEYSGINNIRDHKVHSKTPETIKNEIYNILREAVSTGLTEKPDYIATSISEAKYGYFSTAPVKLIYNSYNKLMICVDYGDGTWEYRWRTVVSVWYGGVVKQIEYTHQYADSEGTAAPSGYTNTQPEGINPPASATAMAVPLGKRSSGGFDIYSTFSLENIVAGTRYYAWSIQEIFATDKIQEKWTNVGNSSMIFAEIDDININYIYNWDVEHAEFRFIGGELARDGNIPTTVELQKVLVHDNYIPPNACVLEPKSPNIRMRFLSSEWQLYIDYKYSRLTNENVTEDIISGANRVPGDKYSHPQVFSVSGEMISVDNVDKSTMSLMAHFKDENGRVISTFATKLLANIVRSQCRSVDIYYAYSALGRQYKLMPEAGFCIDLQQDQPMPDPYKHVEIPNCADHLFSYYSWIGPMWFPYNACRGYDMYDEFTVCNNCQAGYVGPDNEGVLRGTATVEEPSGAVQTAGGGVIKRKDYRYCGPYKYDAFGDSRGNWLASCNCGCRFWYSDASSSTVVFEGYAKAKTTVDLAWYAENGWVPPPFGNDGREYIETYLSQDYLNHLIPMHPFQRDEWLPLMLDDEMFFSTFNAYDDNPEDEYIGLSESRSMEPFRYTTQMNMCLATIVEEKIVTEIDRHTGEPSSITRRFRFDELFDIHHEGNCSYPLPNYTYGLGTSKTVFYYLKDQTHAWAWQEAWRDIERNIRGTTKEEDEFGDQLYAKLDFVDLIRPLYIFDTYKTEYRRIVEEGAYSITYQGPISDDAGNLIQYPSLSIAGGPSRPFEIFYTEGSYDDSQITWKDEGGNSNTQASSYEDNPYEEAMGGDWIHHRDTIFDSYFETITSGLEDVGRRVVTGVSDEGTTYAYFNRGLVAGITREKLYDLPKQLELLGYNGSSFAGESISIDTETINESDLNVPGQFIWQGSTASITSTSDGKWAFAKLYIKGTWGQSRGRETYTLVRPGVSVFYEFEDGSSGSASSQTSSPAAAKEPTSSQVLESYEIYLDFILGPIEMLKKRVTKFIITFTSVTEDEEIDSSGFIISMDEISLYTAVYSEWKIEDIKVWERKYIASELEDITGQGINLDGPGDHLHYQADLQNSGLYFNFRGSTFIDQIVKAVDKTKSVVCGIHYDEDESISITYGNLHDIEDTAQRELYEYAIDLDPVGDELVYAPITPYKYKYFLDNLQIRFPIRELQMFSEKLAWHDHERYKQFEQYSYWRPGGHYYTWNNTFERQKCMLFGGLDDFFQGRYIHVDHQGIGTKLEVDAGKPIDPGNSYYSLRFYVQQAKYDRAMILAGGDPEYNDSMSGGAYSHASTFINPNIVVGR